MPAETDIYIEDEGTIVVFRPRTPAGFEWIEENVHSEPWQWLGNALCVDHRFADDLAAGMLDAGLELE